MSVHAYSVKEGFNALDSLPIGIEDEILRQIFRSRRLLAQDGCREAPCRSCVLPHLEKVRRFLASGEPIRMVLPAFPSKSPNARNVLGILPDRAEVLALQFLQQMCDRIREVYAPGARITIASDGRVFTDLVRLRDEDVTTYTQAVRELIAELGAQDLDVFDLDEAFGSSGANSDGYVPFDVLRDRLTELYAPSLEDVRQRVKAGGQPLNTFNGISRFLFEDRVELKPVRSKSAVRNECKDLAYRVIQRSMAWSGLIGERFPEAVRLSIHAQPSHSAKIGIYLIETSDNWLTPWHGVALKTGDRFVLLKRHQAEELGAELVHEAGRPSYFVLPNGADLKTQAYSAAAS